MMAAVLRWRGAALALSALASMSGCTKVPVAVEIGDPGLQALFERQRKANRADSLHHLNRWEVAARLLVIGERDRERLSFRWSYERERLGAPSRQQVLFYDRLGRTVLAVESDAGGAVLTQSRLEHRQERAEDLSSLIEANTGIAIPFGELSRWLQALDLESLPGSGADSARQHGTWRVEYQEFGDYAGWLMPTKILVAGDRLELRITVSRWDLGEYGDGSVMGEASPEVHGAARMCAIAGAGQNRGGLGAALESWDRWPHCPVGDYKVVFGSCLDISAIGAED